MIDKNSVIKIHRNLGVKFPEIWLYENQIKIYCNSSKDFKSLEKEIKSEIDKLNPGKYWHENHEFSGINFKGTTFRKPLQYVANVKFKMTRDSDCVKVLIVASLFPLFVLSFLLPGLFIAFVKFATGMPYSDMMILLLCFPMLYILNAAFANLRMINIVKKAASNSRLA